MIWRLLLNIYFYLLGKMKKETTSLELSEKKNEKNQYHNGK
jgi:hypothetical protein